ncbi:MAG: AbrB family transcriptional regulator [Alphaproteobacteria bacterium]|nr:AbrB family transcriptional regulator [Alphaproteobacteria bacterium]
MSSLKPLHLWIALIAASVVVSLLLQLTGFPASFLIGPMLTGMVFSVRGAKLSVARPYLLASQSVVGVLVASALDPSILGTISNDWAAILLVVATTVAFSTFAGWMIARTGLLPGTTAAWGCSPGAATGMITMAEEYGADPRLVAFMQFLRVVMVMVVATLVSRFIFGVGAAEQAPDAGSTFIEQLPDLLKTIAVVAAGAVGARVLKVPSGAVFVPLFLAGVLQGLGFLTITLPPWLLITAFSLIGLWVGLRFTRETVRYAFRALPVMLLGTLTLIALCGLSAVMLVWLIGTDPLTAFLATIPGALEAVSIIAVSSNADVSFILALQTIRLFVVIVTGPMLAKMICKML